MLLLLLLDQELLVLVRGQRVDRRLDSLLQDHLIRRLLGWSLWLRLLL